MRRAFVLLIVVVAFLAGTLAAVAAVPPTPAQLSIYVRGWIDGAAPPGVYVTSATCTAAHSCTVRLNDGSCARATVTAYAFSGPWHRCAKREGHPPA